MAPPRGDIRGGLEALPRVELDDHLFVDGQIEVFTRGKLRDPPIHRIPLEPARQAAVAADLLDDRGHLSTRLGERDRLARTDEIGGDVDFAAVYEDVAVADHLTGHRPAPRKAQSVDDVVEA